MVAGSSVLTGCSDIGLFSSGDDDDERPTPFTDRNRRPDPDFIHTYEIIDDPIDVDELYRPGETREAELLVAIDNDRVFLMTFHAQTGYSLVFFDDDEQATDFRLEAEKCSEDAYTHRRSRSEHRPKDSRIYYEQESDEDTNYIELRLTAPSSQDTPSDERRYSRVCEISLIDFRDVFIDNMRTYYLSHRQTYELGKRIRKALVELNEWGY